MKTASPPCSRQVAEQQEEREAEPDPGDAEHGHRDATVADCLRLGDALEQERERERREEPAERPLGPRAAAPSSVSERPAIAGDHDRPQRRVIA